MSSLCVYSWCVVSIRVLLVRQGGAEEMLWDGNDAVAQQCEWK